MLGSGLPPVLLQVSGQSPLAQLLRPGQTLQGTVQSREGALVLRVGNQQVPLASASGLAAGQTVTVRAESADAGLRLFVQPAPVQGTGTPANSPLGEMIASVLKALGAEKLAGSAARLLPPGMPPTQARIEQLLTLFTRPSGMGRDLSTIVQLLNSAAAAGAFPPDRAAELARWLMPESLADAKALHDRLLRFARQRAPEGRLAGLLAGGITEEGLLEFRGLLRQQLVELQSDAALLAYLRTKGKSKTFDGTLNRVLENWRASDLQNLHAQNQPYLFFELPVDAPFGHARLHLFGESKDGSLDKDQRGTSAVIDVSLSQLGELWIQLTVHGETCRCTIRAATDAGHAALEAETVELQEQLAALGYRGVSVTLGRWDGDALRATAELMAQSGPLDVSA